VQAFVDLRRILRELRPLHDHVRRAFGDCTERHCALRDVVDVLLQLLTELVEQLVQRDEARALHVPVRVLRLQV